MRSRRVVRVSLATVTALVVGSLASAGLAVADTPPTPTDPTVSILSPTTQEIAHGVIHVTVLGSVDPASSYSPTSLDLVLSGRGTIKSRDCATYDTNPSPYECEITFTWDTNNFRDPQTLSAEMHTTDLTALVESPPVQVHIFHTPKLTLTAPKTLRAGGHFPVGGSVTMDSLSPASRAHVLITYKPVVGHGTSVLVGTNADGKFSTKILAVAGGSISAKVVASPLYGTSVRTAQANAIPFFDCTMQPTAHRNAPAVGHCIVPYLTVGTRASLQFKVPNGWRNFFTGPVPTAGRVHWDLEFTYRGTYYLRIVTTAHDSFVQGISKPMKVVIS